MLQLSTRWRHAYKSKSDIEMPRFVLLSPTMSTIFASNYFTIVQCKYFPICTAFPPTLWLNLVFFALSYYSELEHTGSRQTL